MRISQLASAPPSSTTFTGGAPDVGVTWVVSGWGLELLDQAREGLAERGVALVAAPLGCAGGKGVVEPPAGIVPEAAQGDRVRGDHQVQGHAADPLGMLAHQREREIGAVGDPVRVPLGDPQRHAQVGEVSGVLGRVIGTEVDPLLDETSVASPCRRRLQASRRRGVVDQTDPAGDELETLRAEQKRLGERHPALVHENELSVAVEPFVDQSRRCVDRAAAGTPGQIRDGSGAGVRDTAGTIATARRMLRPVGRLRFSGTTRYRSARPLAPEANPRR